MYQHLINTVFIKALKEVTVHPGCLFLDMLHNSLVASAWRMNLLQNLEKNILG